MTEYLFFRGAWAQHKPSEDSNGSEAPWASGAICFESPSDSVDHCRRRRWASCAAPWRGWGRRPRPRRPASSWRLLIFALPVLSCCRSVKSRSRAQASEPRLGSARGHSRTMPDASFSALGPQSQRPQSRILTFTSARTACLGSKGGTVALQVIHELGSPGDLVGMGFKSRSLRTFRAVVYFVDFRGISCRLSHELARHWTLRCWKMPSAPPHSILQEFSSKNAAM